MFLPVLTGLMLAVALVTSGPAWSYDTAMAASYARLFAPVKGAEAGKALHLTSAEAFIDALKAKEPMVVVDIRTPAETGVYGLTLPGSLKIPTSELFKKENLALLPTDRPVVITCLSGARAGAAGTALRHIGFDNVYILKDGFKGLVAYYGSTIANTPLKKPAAAKK